MGLLVGSVAPQLQQKAANVHPGLRQHMDSSSRVLQISMQCMPVPVSCREAGCRMQQIGTGRLDPATQPVSLTFPPAAGSCWAYLPALSFEHFYIRATEG
jgi:hypothetical protein